MSTVMTKIHLFCTLALICAVFFAARVSFDCEGFFLLSSEDERKKRRNIQYPIPGGVAAYSFGAPWQVCLIMFPKHRVLEQTTECPFKILTNQSEYLPGDIISVSIRSVDERQWKGIHMRALPVNGDHEKILGQFLTWPISKIQAYDCFNGTQNYITHRNIQSTSEITLTWQAPNEPVGDIVFVMKITSS